MKLYKPEYRGIYPKPGQSLYDMQNRGWCKTAGTHWTYQAAMKDARETAARTGEHTAVTKRQSLGGTKHRWVYTVWRHPVAHLRRR